MEIAKSARALGTKLDGYNAGADSECAKAMAEAERVLRELSLSAPRACRSNPGRSSSVAERRSDQSVVSSRSAEPRAALPSAGRLRLDPDLDFVIHDDGVIDLTEAGFRRMVQAHSAGLNAVIGIDSREVLRLPAPKLGHAPCAAGSRQAIKPRCAELIEAHIRRTQPVAELLKAEESSEAALNMIIRNESATRSSPCCHGMPPGPWIAATPSVSSGRLQRTANWRGATNSSGRNLRRRSA